MRFRSNTLTPSRTSIRPSLLAAIASLASLASLATPAQAHAQSNQGSIGVVATILPAPAILSPAMVTLSRDDAGTTLLSIANEPTNAARRVTSFVRLTRGDSDDSRLAFVAQPANAATTVRLLATSSSEIRLRLERLVTAGT